MPIGNWQSHLIYPGWWCLPPTFYLEYECIRTRASLPYLYPSHRTANTPTNHTISPTGKEENADKYSGLTLPIVSQQHDNTIHPFSSLLSLLLTGLIHPPSTQAFLKKLAMLPCPLATAPFFPPLEAAELGAGFNFLGGASSSEKDSQTVSSLVTVLERGRSVD